MAIVPRRLGLRKIRADPDYPLHSRTRRRQPMAALGDDLSRMIFDEISAAAAQARRMAKRNYFFAYGVAGITVIASIAAGITVGMADVPKSLVAALAALPAVMLTASTVFRFEQKSAWFWKKTKALEALVRQLKYESLAAAQASKAFSEVESSLEREWIGFGTAGKSQD
jgi:hypothetical protein